MEGRENSRCYSANGRIYCSGKTTRANKGEELKSLVEGKLVLVTGGTGTIGSEIVRRLLLLNPHTVRILSNNENELHEFQRELEGVDQVRFLLGDVRDYARLLRALDGVDLVFHCAGLKHVRACEYNPFEAVKTNIIGTQNLVEACVECETERVIFTSTDKAANPANTMGASKLMAEKLITAANYFKGKRNLTFSSVRFGNVLSSRGSFPNLAVEQVKKGGPVTITDHRMTRFLLRLSRSVDLVFEAMGRAVGGEVFILKMNTFKVTDLIDVIKEEIGAPDCPVEEIGMLPGEKTYEELMTTEESLRTLELEHMFVILPPIRDLEPIGYEYEGAKQYQGATYNSDEGNHLSPGEIRSLLKEEGII